MKNILSVSDKPQKASRIHSSEGYSIEESIQHTMTKIAEHVMKFMADIATDIKANERLSARISGDGQFFIIEVHNNITNVRVGRSWTYKDILDIVSDKAKAELLFNQFVEECDQRTKDFPPSEETYWL